MYYLQELDNIFAQIDTDGSGAADTTDDAFTEVTGYASSITVTDAGTILYGTSSVTADGSDNSVSAITSATNPFLGTSTIAWMEVF